LCSAGSRTSLREGRSISSPSPWLARPERT
jgi:hypothetical protein